MNTFLTVLIMCLLGYVAFVFLAESFNPFKKNRFSINSDRRRGASIIASLLALSGIMAFVDQSSELSSKLGSSLGLAIVLVALSIIFLATVQLFQWWSLRRETRAEQRYMLQKSKAHQQAKEQSVAKQNPDYDQTTTVAEQKLSDEQMNDIRHAKPTSHQNKTIDDILLEPGSRLNAQTAANQSNFRSTQFELQTPYNKKPADHSDVVADDLFDSSIVSSEKNNDAAANTMAEENLTNDALHDSTAGIEIFEANEAEALETNTTTSTNYTAPLFDDDEQESDVAEWEYIESESESSSDDAANTNSASSDIDWPASNTTDVHNGENINELQEAIFQVSEHTDQLDNSVQTIASLTRKEAYYRTRMEEAQIAFEQAQRKQLDSQHLEIQRSDQAREKEVQSRIEVEKNLSDKLFLLRQAQMRVRELEIELAERQSVFTDQMESLEKTKAMARDAASLARRAAVAQHRARTEALKERAARERVEVSAKKAVDIARNAISKLAEEEKRNRRSAH